MSKFIKSKAYINGMLKLVFQGQEMDQSIINAIRRIIIGESPSYSLLGNFTIHLNTSELNDEYIMTRIQMIPLFVQNFNDVSFFEQKPLFFISSPDDPKTPLINENDRDLIVNTHMFQIFDQSGNNITDKYPIESIIKYNMPILKLRKGQEFHLEVEPSLGIGHNHASFKSAIVTYKFENPVSSGDKTDVNNSPITGEKIETIADKKNYYKDETWENPSNISMTIRENGHYTVDDSFRLALQTLENKLLRLQVLIDNKNTLASENNTSIEIIPSTDIDNYIQIRIQDPDNTDTPIATHTIGNLIATHMNYRIGKMTKMNIEQIRLSMASYKRPHPLDEIIYINVKAPPGIYNDDKVNPSERLIDDTISDILGYINKVQAEFK
tara:strand:- start:6386 stop:7531 length:1146 start_codon:yes stop_codon:yes gene_type:complete